MGFEQIKDLAPLLTQIDELQRNVDALKAEQPDAYDRIMDNWAVESTYNSNNIEGSTLSLGDTALLFKGAQVDAPADDVRQAEGGFAALRFLHEVVANGTLFSEEIIKRAHELAFAEAKDPRTRGAYRTVEVEISGTDFQPTPAAYVQERMAQLVSSIGRSKKHAAITAALFHLEFESIHPFVNANGRTGRLMSNLLLMQAGYEPINIQAESRARYVAAIRAFQLDDDPYPFAAFFCLNLAERLQKIEALLGAGILAETEEEISALEQFLLSDSETAPEVDPPSIPQVPPKLTTQVLTLVGKMGCGEYSTKDLMDLLLLKDRKNFRARYLNPALEAGVVERTVPDKPNSSKQKYRKVER